MSDLSSFEERQEDEVEFLKAVFPNSEDFKDLRLNDTWKVKPYTVAIGTSNLLATYYYVADTVEPLNKWACWDQSIL